jgi:hypothetical protein
MSSSVPTTQAPTRVNHVDLYNLREIIGQDAEAVMVYGIGGCAYTEVDKGIKKLIPQSITSTITDNSKSLKPLKKVYDYNIGIRGKNPRSVDGTTPIPQIEYADTPFAAKTIARQCKAGVTNLTIFNTLLEAQEQTTIPTIFCVEGTREDPTTSASTWHITDKTIHSKEPALNDKITMKETRRVGKLCFDEQIDPRVRAVAQKNFHFVSVTEKLDHDELTNTDHYTYLLSRIDAPWGKTTESQQTFKDGLRTRASEKESTLPLERAIRRINATATIREKEEQTARLKVDLTGALKYADEDDGLTAAEVEDFDQNFNWDTVYNSDRQFTCFEGGGPKTLKQAFNDALIKSIETRSFRTQVNQLVSDTLDIGTIIVQQQTDLQHAQEPTTTETETTQPTTTETEVMQTTVQQQEVSVEV